MFSTKVTRRAVLAAAFAVAVCIPGCTSNPVGVSPSSQDDPTMSLAKQIVPDTVVKKNGNVVVKQDLSDDTCYEYGGGLSMCTHVEGMVKTVQMANGASKHVLHYRTVFSWTKNGVVYNTVTKEALIKEFTREGTVYRARVVNSTDAWYDDGSQCYTYTSVRDYKMVNGKVLRAEASSTRVPCE